MHRRKHIIGLGLLLAASISLPAVAQPATQTYPQCGKAVTPNESELAHQKYIAGKQDYDEGNYESAIRRFRDAYTLDCTKHELLIIISAAYERRGDKKEAVGALEAYVNRASSAPDVVTYQAKIENLKKQIAAAPPPAATTGPAATSGTPGAAASTASAEPQEHTAYPWIVVGLGAATMVAGAVIIATTPSLPRNCSPETTKCTRENGESNEDFLADQKQAGQHVDQPGVGLVVLGAGALVAIGGLVWHFLEPTGPKESTKAKLRPAVVPGYAGLSLGGTF